MRLLIASLLACVSMSTFASTTYTETPTKYSGDYTIHCYYSDKYVTEYNAHSISEHRSVWKVLLTSGKTIYLPTARCEILSVRDE